MTKGLSHCDICGAKDIKIKNTIKLNNKRICKKCYREDKKGRRKLRGHFPAGKYADRNFPRMFLKKPVKREYYLTFEEKQILFGQLIRLGLDGEGARKRINSLSNYEKEFFKDMREKARSEKELNKKFKTEFKKLLENENRKSNKNL